MTGLCGGGLAAIIERLILSKIPVIKDYLPRNLIIQFVRSKVTQEVRNVIDGLNRDVAKEVSKICSQLLEEVSIHLERIVEEEYRREKAAVNVSEIPQEENIEKLKEKLEKIRELKNAV